MAFRKKHSGILGFAGSFALILGLVRCSPVAPSVFKQDFNGGGLPSPTMPSPTGSSGGSALGTALPVTSHTTVKSVEDDSPAAIYVDPETESSISIRVVSLTREHLKQIRDNARAEIEVEEAAADQTSSEIEFVVVVDYSDSEIFDQYLSEFKLRAQMSELNLMVLDVDKGVDPEVRDRVLGNLQSVSMVIRTGQAKASEQQKGK